MSIEPTAEELASAHWFKATKSQNQGGCVEIAHLPQGTAVRNSRMPSKGHLLFTEEEWDCFLDGALKGEFDRPQP